MSKTFRSRFDQIISLTFLFAISVCSISCGDNHYSGSPLKGQQVMRINLRSEPPTLDPRKAFDSLSSPIIKMVFEGLTRMTPDGKASPSAADRIEISGDRLTYTFHIRPNQWTNGEPVTAYDFYNTWKTTLDPTFGAPFADQFFIIRGAEEHYKQGLPFNQVGIKAIDAKTFQVTLNNPTPYFLQLTAHLMSFPTHTATAVKDPNWATEAGEGYVSNGPFRLAVWKHNYEIVVEKNPLYWDSEVVKLDWIKISMVDNCMTELSLYENGDLDWAGNPLTALATEALPDLQKRKLVHSKPTAASYAYCFNLNDPVLKNEKIRKALGYAIDRASLVDNILLGGQIPAMGWVPPTMPFPHKEFFEDADFAVAKQLFEEGLQELGLTRQTLPKLTLSYNTLESHHRIAQAIQQQWYTTLGIDIGLENMEWKVYLDKMQKGQFQIGRSAWVADYNDPVTFLDIYKDKEVANNYTGWENKTYEHLLDQANRVKSTKERNALLLEAEGILIGEMPMVPIYYYTENYLKKPYVKGFYLGPISDIDFKWAHIEVQS
jgi:oligopeptide transport system substrate-binding protein